MSAVEAFLQNIAVERLPWARLIFSVVLNTGALLALQSAPNAETLAFIGVALASSVVLTAWATMGLYGSLKTSALHLTIGAAALTFCISAPFLATPESMLRSMSLTADFEFGFAIGLLGFSALYASVFYLIRRRSGISIRLRAQALGVALFAAVVMLPMRWPMLIWHHLEELPPNTSQYEELYIATSADRLRQIPILNHSDFLIAPAVRCAWRDDKYAERAMMLAGFRPYLTENELEESFKAEKGPREQALLSLYLRNRNRAVEAARTRPLCFFYALPAEILGDWVSRCDHAKFEFEIRHHRLDPWHMFQLARERGRYDLIFKSKAEFFRMQQNAVAVEVLDGNLPGKLELFALWDPPRAKSLTGSPSLQGFLLCLDYKIHAVLKFALKDPDARVRNAALIKMLSLFDKEIELRDRLNLSDMTDTEAIDRACWTAGNMLSYEKIERLK